MKQVAPGELQHRSPHLEHFQTIATALVQVFLHGYSLLRNYNVAGEVHPLSRGKMFHALLHNGSKIDLTFPLNRERESRYDNKSAPVGGKIQDDAI
jgi:hypothetical protein